MRLELRKRQGNFRSLKIVENLIDFASNDYLGLARSPVTDYLHGSTGSRLLTGNSKYVQDLEDQIAAFHGYEAGLIFGCGYMANVGLISALGNNNTILFDTAIHASTRDGIRLSRSKAYPFRHNDMNHLEKRLKGCPGNSFICVESIYSTDGTKAPLKEIGQLATKYNAHLIVDEAHAVGICGPQGKGLVEGQVFAQVTTFGKALGAYGAIVLGSKKLKQILINFATPFMYSTALPFCILSKIKWSYDKFPLMENERNHLKILIEILGSETHIKAIPMKYQPEMKNFDVRLLKSPTVQRGHEVLRICLHSFNTENEVKELITWIKSL